VISFKWPLLPGDLVCLDKSKFATGFESSMITTNVGPITQDNKHVGNLSNEIAIVLCYDSKSREYLIVFQDIVGWIRSVEVKEIT